MRFHIYKNKIFKILYLVNDKLIFIPYFPKLRILSHVNDNNIYSFSGISNKNLI